jgi:hypothetical protein
LGRSRPSARACTPRRATWRCRPSAEKATSKKEKTENAEEPACVETARRSAARAGRARARSNARAGPLAADGIRTARRRDSGARSGCAGGAGVAGDAATWRNRFGIGRAALRRDGGRAAA